MAYGYPTVVERLIDEQLTNGLRARLGAIQAPKPDDITNDGRGYLQCGYALFLLFSSGLLGVDCSVPLIFQNVHTHTLVVPFKKKVYAGAHDVQPF